MSTPTKTVKAANPDKLRTFLNTAPQLPAVSTGTLGASVLGTTATHGQGSLNGLSSLGKRPAQAPPAQRGELKTFQTTFRGGANLLAPPSPAPRPPGSVTATPPLSKAPPDVGTKGGRSLDDVWRTGLFAQADGLADVDRTKVLKPDGAGNVMVPRLEPDRFHHGRVLRGKLHVDKVPEETLNRQSDGLMHPRERRAQHDAEVNARLGYVALRDAYKQRKKLSDHCSINYPHGVLGCSETPYAESGLSSEVYKAQATALVREDVRAQRKGRARGTAVVEDPQAKGMDIGTIDRPGRRGGKARVNIPRDTIDLRMEQTPPVRTPQSEPAL